MRTNIPIDFSTMSIDCGHVGEHNAVQFDIVIPSDMIGDGNLYRVAIQPDSDIETHRSAAISPVDGVVSYILPQSLTGSKSLVLQLEEYSGDTFLKKSDIVIARLRDSTAIATSGVDDDAEIVAEITANTAARHTHSNSEALDAITAEDLTAYDDAADNAHSHDNKSVIDKFAESDGKPTYNGQAIGGELPDEVKVASVVSMIKAVEGSNVFGTARYWANTAAAMSGDNGIISNACIDMMQGMYTKRYFVIATDGEISFIDCNFEMHTHTAAEGDVLVQTDDSTFTLYSYTEFIQSCYALNALS